MQLVPAVGFEPTTFCSEDRRSNPLSYAGMRNSIASDEILLKSSTDRIDSCFGLGSFFVRHALTGLALLFSIE